MRNRRARFWWFLRNAWHMPGFWCHGGYGYNGWPSDLRAIFGPHELLKYETRWDDIKYRWYCVKHMTRTHLRHPSYIAKDAWEVARGVYWTLRYLQPFRCNGNKGGWRTDVCDWLENKAREAENEA